MRFSEYQQAAARTVKSDLTREEKLANFAALVGEQYKKYLFHKKPLDIGLCQYRLAYVVSCVQKIAGNKFYSVLDGNIKKLLERHPDGFQGNYKSSDEEGSTHAVSAT